MSPNNLKEKAPAPSQAESTVNGASSTSGLIPDSNESSTTENNGNSFDRIASSASSLFQSLLRPVASEASGSIQSSQQSKGQASTAPGNVSSHYYWEQASSASRQHGQPSCASTNLPNSMEFRTIPVASESSTSIDGEYQMFINELSGFRSAPVYREPTETPQTVPQEDILQLLSSPTLTEAVWDPVPSTYLEESTPTVAYRPNLQDTRVTEFLAADDIVEFLSKEGTIYTEEVWGNMLGLLREAPTEIEKSKGKGKESSQNSNAVERLKMIQRQLRSKL